MIYGTSNPLYAKAQVEACKHILAATEAAGIAMPIHIVSSSKILLTEPSYDLNGVDPGGWCWD